MYHETITNKLLVLALESDKLYVFIYYCLTCKCEMLLFLDVLLIKRNYYL